MTRPAGTADVADRLPGGHWRNVVPLLDVGTRRASARKPRRGNSTRGRARRSHRARSARRAAGLRRVGTRGRLLVRPHDRHPKRSQGTDCRAESADLGVGGRVGVRGCAGAAAGFRADGRTRAGAGARRKLLPASDLVFADGLDLTQKMSAAIEQARAAEVAASDDTLAGDWPPAGVLPCRRRRRGAADRAPALAGARPRGRSRRPSAPRLRAAALDARRSDSTSRSGRPRNRRQRCPSRVEPGPP